MQREPARRAPSGKAKQSVHLRSSRDIFFFFCLGVSFVCNPWNAGEHAFAASESLLLGSTRHAEWRSGLEAQAVTASVNELPCAVAVHTNAPLAHNGWQQAQRYFIEAPDVGLAAGAVLVVCERVTTM